MRWMVALLAFAVSMPAATFYLTVAGLGGEPEYEQRFAQWARSIETAVRSSQADARIDTLQGPAATREAVRGAVGKIASAAKSGDSVVLMLIGHGSFDGHDYKLNLPGPDVTAAELAALLDGLPAGRQLVVNMTSASGGALDTLRRENRVVITATKSGTEKNATIFARYWADCLRDPSADTDKNEAISALEAFRYASRKTAEFYESQKRLATEHPLIDEAGKPEGALSASFTLLRFGAAQAAAKDPAKQKLLARKDELERRIAELKYRKAALAAEEYKKQLTALLIELAKAQEGLEK